jgi:hypothetical protein
MSNIHPTTWFFFNTMFTILDNCDFLHKLQDSSVDLYVDFFFCKAFFHFGIKVMRASSNKLGSLPFTSIIWQIVENWYKPLSDPLAELPGLSFFGRILFFFYIGKLLVMDSTSSTNMKVIFLM